ncbi:unnamed protein product, partial [Owenia fusiformis]
AGKSPESRDVSPSSGPERLQGGGVSQSETYNTNPQVTTLTVQLPTSLNDPINLKTSIHAEHNVVDSNNGANEEISETEAATQSLEAANEALIHDLSQVTSVAISNPMLASSPGPRPVPVLTQPISPPVATSSPLPTPPSSSPMLTIPTPVLISPDTGLTTSLPPQQQIIFSPMLTDQSSGLTSTPASIKEEMTIQQSTMAQYVNAQYSEHQSLPSTPTTPITQHTMWTEWQLKPGQQSISNVQEPQHQNVFKK